LYKIQIYLKKGKYKSRKLQTPETTYGDVQREEHAIIKPEIHEFEEQDFIMFGRTFVHIGLHSVNTRYTLHRSQNVK